MTGDSSRLKRKHACVRQTSSVTSAATTKRTNSWRRRSPSTGPSARGDTSERARRFFRRLFSASPSEEGPHASVRRLVESRDKLARKLEEHADEVVAAYRRDSVG